LWLSPLIEGCFCRIIIIIENWEEKKGKGFFSHKAIPVKKGQQKMPSPLLLLYNAKSLLLIGCSSAEPISSSTS